MTRHFASMEDYQEAECDAGRHEWEDGNGDPVDACMNGCGAYRCRSREIVYGRSVLCDQAIAAESDNGYCAEHHVLDQQETGRMLVRDLASEETAEDRRKTADVLWRHLAEMTLGAKVVAEIEAQYRLFTAGRATL